MRSTALLLPALILLAAAATAPSGVAAQDSPLTVRVERADSTAEPLDRIRPGEDVRWVLVFTNPADAPLTDVVFDDPIPSGFVYRLGSARADDTGTAIEFSIDGGRTFVAEPTVEARDETGRTVRRPAPPESYTHIRWTVAGPLDVGAAVTAAFEATLGPVVPAGAGS